MSDSTEEMCGLCGNVAVGWAVANGKRLCHAPERDCYHRWTVFGERPGKTKMLGKVGCER